MRISDWSSDVCSSDLRLLRRRTDRFADGRVVGLPQISDQIGTFPRIGDARITHRGAGNGLRRMGDEVIERGATPDDLRMLHRRRIFKARHAAGASAEQTTVVWAGAIVGERMAGAATGVDFEIGRASCRERVCEYV